MVVNVSCCINITPYSQHWALVNIAKTALALPPVFLTNGFKGFRRGAWLVGLVSVNGKGQGMGIGQLSPVGGFCGCSEH